MKVVGHITNITEDRSAYGENSIIITLNTGIDYIITWNAFTQCCEQWGCEVVDKNYLGMSPQNYIGAGLIDVSYEGHPDHIECQTQDIREDPEKFQAFRVTTTRGSFHVCLYVLGRALNHHDTCGTQHWMSGSYVKQGRYPVLGYSSSLHVSVGEEEEYEPDEDDYADYDDDTYEEPYPVW